MPLTAIKEDLVEYGKLDYKLIARKISQDPTFLKLIIGDKIIHQFLNKYELSLELYKSNTSNKYYFNSNFTSFQLFNLFYKNDFLNFVEILNSTKFEISLIQLYFNKTIGYDEKWLVAFLNSNYVDKLNYEKLIGYVIAYERHEIIDKLIEIDQSKNLLIYTIKNKKYEMFNYVLRNLEIAFSELDVDGEILIQMIKSNFNYLFCDSDIAYYTDKIIRLIISHAIENKSKNIIKMIEKVHVLKNTEYIEIQKLNIFDIKKSHFSLSNIFINIGKYGPKYMDYHFDKIENEILNGNIYLLQLMNHRQIIKLKINEIIFVEWIKSMKNVYKENFQEEIVKLKIKSTNILDLLENHFSNKLLYIQMYFDIPNMGNKILNYCIENNLFLSNDDLKMLNN